MRRQNKGEGGTIIGLLIAGAGVWFLGDLFGWWGGGSAAAAATTPATGTTTGTTATATNTGTTATPPTLTAAQLATTAFSSATQSQLSALSSAVNALIAAGQVPTIDSGSDLAFMLGWGGSCASGATQSTNGQTYTCDGTNWNLTPTPGAPPPPPPPAPKTAASNLTAAQLATTAFTSAQTSQFSTALNNAVDALLQAGSIQTINGNSDLAYMLGWGGAAKGVTQSVYGHTYTFDGTNWQLTSTAAGSSNPTADASGNCPSGYVNVTGLPGAQGYCVKASGTSGYGLAGLAAPAGTMTRAYRINYRRKSRFA